MNGFEISGRGEQGKPSRKEDNSKIAVLRALLHAVLEGTPECAAVIARDNTILEINRPGLDLLEAQRAEDVVGRSALDFVVPEQVVAARENTDRVAAGRRARLECDIITGKGTRRTVDTLGIALPMVRSDEPRVGLLFLRDVTELRREERERVLLAAIVNSSTDAIATITPDLRIVTWNRAAEATIGLKAEQAIGQSILAFWPQDQHDQLLKLQQSIVTSGKPRQFEKQALTRDSRVVDVSVTIFPIYNAAGTLIGISSIATDITEQKRAAREKNLLASIVESSDDAIISKTPDCKIGTWNLGAERIYGYSAQEAVGQPVSMLMAPDRLYELEEVLGKVLRGEHLEHYETKRRRKDGQLFDVSLTEFPIRDAGGQVVGVGAIERDISGLRRAWEAESLLASIVRSSPDAIYTVSPQGLITSWNAEAEKLLGYTADEIIGTHIARLAPPELEREPEEILASFVGGERRVRRLETKRRRKDGSLVDVAIAICALEDERGKVEGVSAITRDITQAKRYQEDLKLARDAALDASRLKSEFMTNMSHEIRTPLNSIVGFAGLLLGSELNIEQRDFTENIRLSSEALLGVINDILDFSKMATGKLVFEEIDFDVRTAVEGAVELSEEPAHRKRLELILSIDEKMPRQLRGDPGRLRQVLCNLVANAVKFTEHGEVLLTATVEEEGKGDCLLRFEVKDTGIGIAPLEQARLFRPFSQVDSSTTRRYGGTGLGLAIASQLVKQMNGAIGVTSKLGVGSTFWFTSKFTEPPPATTVAAVEHIEGLRVLVVDDNATNREVVRRQLESWGICASSAPGGREALRILHSPDDRQPYDLALVDLEMPDMNGLELARAVRRDPGLVATRLVMMSSLEGLKQHGEQATGIDAWLTKPVRPSQLFKCLSSGLRRNAASGRQVVQTGTAAFEPHSVPEGDTDGRRNVRILLAEDNIINQKVALHQLRRLGYEADGVANGQEALDALARVPYDVILMDCQMPEMDGYEATALIRTREASKKHTIIIATTAHALEGDRQKCLEAGMDDYIAKPVKSEQLGSVLKRWLSPKTAAPPARAPEGERNILDAATIAELKSDGPDSFAELVTLFFDDSTPKMAELKEARARGDAGAVKNIAHNLKGASGAIGALELQALCAGIQEAAAKGSLEAIDGLISRLPGEYERVRQALEKEKNRSPA